jgi:GNAT superfamily N-acetyltransferase
LPDSGEIIGLFEFSFDLPEGDLHRYASHGVPLDADTDCRFGPTIADDYQNRRLGSRVFPHMVEVARNFGKQRMILWGGVLADNARAIRFYEKQGFEPVGIFEAEDGELLLDMLLALDQARA